MCRIPSLVLLMLFVTVASLGCAAQRQIDRGQAALVANDPVTARHHFRRALEHDPKLAQKPAFAEDYRVARRDAAVVEGEQFLRLHQPLDAIERFTAALRHHPQWPPAVAGLSRAHADAADANHRRALGFADVGQLHRARAELEEGLRHVPTHAESIAALASLNLPAAEQPADYRAGQQHAERREWDAALAAYRQTIAASPNFLPARAAVPAALDAAAQDHLDRGRSLLAGGQFDEAEEVLQRVADFRPDHPELPPALGAVDLSHGDAALADARPGAALLWFRRADDHFAASYATQKQTAQAGITTATHQLRDRHRLTITLTPESTAHPELADDLVGRVTQRLQNRDALALAFSPDGQPVPINLVRLDLPAIDLREESLLHPYTVEYDVPNPIRPSLQRDLHRLDRCIDDLYFRERHLERRHRHLHAAHPYGPSCGCPHEVHRVHRQLDRLRHELHDARRDHRRVSHRLASEPHFITRTRVEHWPYTRSTHERTATAVATFTTPQGATQTLTARVTDADTTISPARLDLGLPEDPLELLTDSALQDELLTRAANRLAHEMGVVLVQSRIDRLTADAHTQQHSDPVAARESRAAAAVLLAALDSKTSERLLNAME